MKMLMWIWILIGIVIVLTIILVFVLMSWYTITPPNYADVVVQKGKMKVFSSHKDYGTEKTSDGNMIAAYYQIPKWFFFGGLGMDVTRMPLEIMDIDVPNFQAFDNQRVRFIVDIVAYVKIKDPITAAQRFGPNKEGLARNLQVIAQSTTRDVTTKKTIREIINNRSEIIGAIATPFQTELEKWGLDLNNVELIDFKDPSTESGIGSHVINDISLIAEKTIESERRQKNAEQLKLARMKEAESEEEAKKRELSKDEVIQKREQEVKMNVAAQQRLAKEKELEVTRTITVTTQEIEKERQVVLASQEKEVAEIDAAKRKEVEAINKEQKELEGAGDRLMMEEQAKGAAAPLRENGLAEAKAIEAKYLAEARGKDELQKALNQFGDKAIRALVAEKIVEMQKEVGIAGAKALEKADLRMFAGSDGGGFDIGKMVAATFTGNESSASSVLNRLARPNDLGFASLDKMTKEETKPAKA